MTSGCDLTPLVSVIVPFYKNSKWLESAIKSVLIQDYDNIELIVVNDGSQENIDYILKKYKKIVYCYQNNQGAAVARNKGIQMANGKYIAFLDSDDLWAKNKISLQVEYMIRNGYKWCHNDCITFSEKRKYIKYISVKKIADYIYPLPAISCYIATPAVIVEKDILLDNDYMFIDNLSAGEDTILWLNLSRKYPIGTINLPLTKVRMHGDNAISNKKSQIEFRHYLLNYLIKEEMIKDIGWFAKIGYRYNEKAYKKMDKNVRKSNIFFFIARVCWNIEEKIMSGRK